MKFSRLKLYFCISLQAVLLLLILIFLPNPILEHLYSKSVPVKTLPSLTVVYELGDNAGTVASAKSDNGIQLPEKTKSSKIKSTLTTAKGDTSVKVISTAPTKTFHPTFTHDRKTTSVTKIKLPRTEKNSLTSRELSLQTQPARTTDRWKVRSVTTAKQTTTVSLKVKSFTAEPEWKIEEDYTLATSASETSCPISVKIKALNSSWLKEKFLTQITIFMDDRHFTDQNWIRLRHFVPPYGWMELNYSVVKEVVSALPRIPDQQLLLAEKSKDRFPRCVSCAVVGNGGILNASGLGREIDQHDYVFRVNGAVIKGYEKDVGVRTSFYGFTAYTMLASLLLLKRKGFSNIPSNKETKYILFTEGERDYEWLKALQQNKEIRRGTLERYRLRPRDDFGEKFDFNRLLVAHPDFVRYLKNRFLRSSTLNGKHWNLYRPSTGALVLLTALHLCDTVSAYGFMTYDYKNYSDHYYDKDKTKVTLYINHDFLMEKDLWAQLHRENIIKLYQRP